MTITPEQHSQIRSLDQYVKLIEGCSGRVGWAAKNAMYHLKMATQIAAIDPLMAAFRSVCAEEEAATALIFSLKRLKYKGADKIRFKSHQDKQMVIVFIQVIKDWYENFHPEIASTLEQAKFYPCEVSGRHAIGLFMPIKGTTDSVFIEPPLSLQVRAGTSWAEIIREGVENICKDSGFEKLTALVSERANFRNTMLYATDSYFPCWKGDIGDLIVNQSGIVGALLRALGLIDPWTSPTYERSAMVEGCIQVFLEVMYPNRSA